MSTTSSPVATIPRAASEQYGGGEEEEVGKGADLTSAVSAREPCPSPEASSSLSSEIGADPGCQDPLFTAQRAAGGEEGGEGEEVDMGGLRRVAEEEDDPISRRTRARYSLANFTMDELETFLQETDDEEDLQNVDDEEEYRKFLAGVLVGDGDSIQVGEEAEDENDADFEIELEELLESDHEEPGKGDNDDNAGARNGAGKKNKGTCDGCHRRPQTRQNRRRRDVREPKEKLLGQSTIPLRPILPSHTLIPSPIAPEPGIIGPGVVPQPGLINGFTPHQIGQLHCLIHEHTQLLIQIYTLCAFEPSTQPIASDVQRLILDLVGVRNEAVSRRTAPYPNFCFRAPYILPSAVNEVPKSSGANSTSSSGQLGEIVSWIPVVGSSIMSVIDVAPLGLVGKYMVDVNNAVRGYAQRHFGPKQESREFELEPLFALPKFSSIDGVVDPSAVPSNSPSHVEQQLQQKKTKAGALVESSKKKSVAFVPRNIMKLAQRFFPMFNPALFAHKPPSAAVSSRVLFTDAEDELLALGIMEYNNDWKSIQERYLPCKTRHQIFVRAKNRCSSKAPENPIKTVRQMKVSPLTAEEKALIYEGLKVFKLDWTSVCKYFVPHRDPALLPRQWRAASGTIKSYKKDEITREKRRLYELKKRQLRKAASSLQNATGREVDTADVIDNSTDENVDEEDEVYVHEAFLAENMSECSRPASSELLGSCSRVNLPPSHMLHEDGIAAEKYATFPNLHQGYFQQIQQSDPTHRYTASQRPLEHGSQHSRVQSNSSLSLPSNQPTLNWTSNGFNRPLQPYRMRKNNATRLVKLAPNLPPVNLPASVRVISQASLPVTGGGDRQMNTGKSVVAAGKNSSLAPRSEIPRSHVPTTCMDQNIPEETGAESDLRMHPLLFQASEQESSQYLSSNYQCASACTLNFFPGSSFHSDQPSFLCGPQGTQIVHNPSCHDHSLSADRLKRSVSKLSALDFHPFLQLADSKEDNNLVPTLSLANPSSLLDTTSGLCQTDDVRQANGNSPTSRSDNPNELDLNIRLSSCSLKEKVAGNRNENGLSGSSIGPVHQNVKNGNQLSSIDYAINTSRWQISDDGFGDLSLTGIVMEHEELSDSDEEVVEDVEFEREEMVDSEGEELDAKNLCDKQVEGSPAVNLERQVIVAKTSVGSGEISVDRGCTLSVGASSATRRKKTADPTNLCLDSSSPGSYSESKRKRGKAGEKPSLKRVCPPSKSNRRKPNKDTGLRDTSQLQPNVHAECSTAASKRKPRTRASPTYSKVGTTVDPQGSEKIDRIKDLKVTDSNCIVPSPLETSEPTQNCDQTAIAS